MAKLYFNYSAMNAGKSTTLLQSAFNYRERGMAVAIFTAAIDDRGGKGKIVSRIGLEETAELFQSDTDLFAKIRTLHSAEKLACIFVDEAQFLTVKQVRQLARVVDELGVPILCYGLRTDFQANLFEGSKALLAIADELRELKTICHCGTKATMNLRIDVNGNAVRDGDSIEIGGNDRYSPLCRKHFFEAFSK